MLGSFIIILATIVLFAKLYVKLKTKYVTEEVDMSGKTVIVTGANAGIGESLAIEFAKRNARVILACRSIIRGEGARQYISCEAKRSDDGIVFKQLDLSSMKSVREFAADINETEQRLDILVNNAAISGFPVTTTEDGLELTYQTNHFGPFLLTNLLLDKLKKSGPESRIINVGSSSNKIASLDLDCLHPDEVRSYFEEKQEGFIKRRAENALYHNTKLMNVMFTFKLAEKLADSGVTVNCVHPGVVRTDKIRVKNLVAMISRVFLEIIAKNSIEGCQPVLHCAISKQLNEVSGKYFSEFEIDENVHEMAQDKKACAKLWDISEKLTGYS